MKKVQVLLSSYNGEKYIEEQIDSIFNQSGVEVHCLVRDDGSTDSTPDIIFNCQKKYVNLDFIKENNIGYKASFMRLIQMSDQHEYYAFADQDDVWQPEKLLKAIESIEDIEDKCPIMYCSNCIVVDSNLNYLGMLHVDEDIIPSNKIKALVQGFAHGCTIVLNSEARNSILKYKPQQEYAHDFWIPIIIMLMGKIVYDKNSYIFYRQHGDNCFGSTRSIKKMIETRLKIKDNYYSNMIMEILNGYQDVLKPEDKLMLKKILEYKYTLYNKFKLLSNMQLTRNTLRGTLFLKILVITSKF